MKGTRTYQNAAVVGVFVTLVAVAMAIVQYKIPTILPVLMTNLHMDATAGSWLMTIFVLMMVFSAIPFGILAQRFGARTISVVAVAIIVIGSVVGAFSQGTSVLLASRAVEGIAITAITVCGPILIEGSVDPRDAGTAMGIWGTWGPLGSTVAALATPTLFALWGMSVLWLVYAAIVVVAAILMLAIVKKPNSAADQQDGGAARFGRLFTRDMLLYFVGFIAFNVCLLAVLSYVPTILQNRGMDATASGLVSTLPMILSLVSSPFFGRVSDKTGKTKRLLVLTVAFLGPCAFVLYVSSGAVMWGAAVVMGLVGMGSTGLMILGLMKVLPDPSLKTIGMGALITVQGIGQFLGTFLVQLLLGPAFDNVYIAGAGVLAIGIVGTVCLAACRFRAD